MHKKLFIPGPIEVKEDILSKMAMPMIGHRSKEASNLQRDISNNLRKLFFTENEILLSSSSGSGLMEAAVRCCTKERAAIFSIGSFGDRWHEMAVSNGINADLFKSELGSITSPDMVDQVLSTGKYDLVTITHNETSTGVMNPIDEISKVIKKYPQVIFCVDAVSSAAGVKIDSKPLHGIQIAPGLKFIGNFKSGWQPYASVQMVWNIMDKSRFTANDVSLPELSVKPYFQYGVGLQKSWGERFTAYGQAMLRSGGRNGLYKH